MECLGSRKWRRRIWVSSSELDLYLSCVIVHLQASKMVLSMGTGKV